MKIFDFKGRIQQFLRARGLELPDGRYLYAYNVSPEEFSDLENCLKQSIRKFYEPGLDNPLDVWHKSEAFNAFFVLYTALCWQQKI